MRRYILVSSVCACLLALSGCASWKTKPHSSAELDRILMDQQLLEAARSIQRTQAELRALVGVRTGARMSDLDLADMKAAKPISIQWQGDAGELLHVLAASQGLAVVTRGIPVSVPVSLNATQLPLTAVIALLRAQLDHRASVYTQEGSLVIDYNPTQGIVH